MDELYKIKGERTHIKLEGDNEVEHGECIGTQCEGQVNLPQEQRERICSLEAGRDQVSPAGPCEVERVYDEWVHAELGGGADASGPLVLTPTPDVIVPECVSRCASKVSKMACKCMRGIDTRTEPDGRRV